MTAQEDENAESEDEIIVKDGRLTGCRGRVLVAVLVLAVLLTLLLVMLARGVLTKTDPQPVKRASADSVAHDVVPTDVARRHLNA